MKLPFEKWHGCKNDFIIFRTNQNEAKYLMPSLQRQAPTLCSRKGDGIGADGILVLMSESSSPDEFKKLTIINQDGSIAKNCGNGLRCAFGSLYRSLHLKNQHDDRLPECLELDVEGRTFTGQPLKLSFGNNQCYIGISMPEARLNDRNPWHDTAKLNVNQLLNQPRHASFQCEQWHSYDIGNPHIVLFTDLPQNLEQIDQLGPDFQTCEGWDGINLHIAHPENIPVDQIRDYERILGGNISENFRVRVWERGVGETSACGSGACAVAASVLDSGLLDRDDWVMISMPGGPLFVRQRDQDDPVFLAGPAQFCFEGAIDC